MRHFGITTAALLAALAPGAAVASVISESVPINIVGSGLYEGSIDVYGLGFDSSLGTLKHETLAFSGTFTPGFQWPCCEQALPPGHDPYPASVPVTLTGYFGIYPPNGLPIALAPENVTAVENLAGGNPPLASSTYVAIGTPEPLTITNTVPAGDFDFGLAAITVVGAWTEPTGAYNAESWALGTGSGDPADRTQVMGTLTATFIYAPAHPVPEPASFALLASGLLGLGVGLRRHPTP